MSRLALSLVLASVLSSSVAAHSPAPLPASATPTAVTDSIHSATLRIAPPVVDRAKLRAKLLAARRANLARFRAYRIAGVYPSNVFMGGLAHVWRDQQGNYCAAATIIRASGQVELVDRIAEEDNFFRIADVEQGPVMDWILTSGLTHEELVLIQKPFMPVTTIPVLDPEKPIAIDPTLRAKETRRLAKLYRTIERKLLRTQRASLDAAVERLAQRPDLAAQFLGS